MEAFLSRGPRLRHPKVSRATSGGAPRTARRAPGAAGRSAPRRHPRAPARRASSLPRRPRTRRRAASRWRRDRPWGRAAAPADASGRRSAIPQRHQLGHRLPADGEDLLLLVRGRADEVSASSIRAIGPKPIMPPPTCRDRRHDGPSRRRGRRRDPNPGPVRSPGPFHVPCRAHARTPAAAPLGLAVDRGGAKRGEAEDREAGEGRAAAGDEPLAGAVWGMLVMMLLLFMRRGPSPRDEGHYESRPASAALGLRKEL